MSTPKSHTLTTLLTLVLVAGCDRSIGARIQDIAAVEISDIAPVDLKKDSFTVDDPVIEGAALQLTVASGGGCEKHSYSLVMTPAVFMESFPVQANIYLRHDAHDDPCDAIVRDSVVFDLTPITDLYRQLYGTNGQIALNLYNFDQTVATRLTLQLR